MRLRIIDGKKAGMEALESRRNALVSPTKTTPQAAELSVKVFGEPLTPQDAVRRILDDVRTEGFDAVRRYTELLDGAAPQNFETPRREIDGAIDKIDPDLRQALEFSADRVERFHRASMPTGWKDDELGFGERIEPMERAGVYAPGGTASYPSTVLMTAIPARVAGVSDVYLCTPSTAPSVLAAAKIAGVSRVFRIGGAQAIGAMAYGAGDVPKADIICGPGNLFVTLAKQMVYGSVAIDGLYGPTETALIADDSADPAHCAADLLAQAEHDPLASPILLTNSRSLLETLPAELERQLSEMRRSVIAEHALRSGGFAVLVDTIEEAIELANDMAPEHLCLLMEDAEQWAPLVKHAGGLFLGHFSPEVVGDYVAGPSHVMPTGGTARFSSALGVHQFLRHMPTISLNESHFPKMAEAVSTIAAWEGLHGHASAVNIRLQTEGEANANADKR